MKSFCANTSEKKQSEEQNLLYADNHHALQLIFQAMDAAGKDSAIKHVMSGVNPQGCQFSVSSTLAPRNWNMIFCGTQRAACPNAGTSASSIAPTTRKC
jgi:polyphosphate kinase 2 (PPK2 family)